MTSQTAVKKYQYSATVRSAETGTAAIEMIPAKTKLLTVEGAGHDLGFKGKAKHVDLTSAVLAAFKDFLG